MRPCHGDERGTLRQRRRGIATDDSVAGVWALAGGPAQPGSVATTDHASASEQLPMLLASCVLAGLIASQAVYYDDDGDPTGVRMQHSRQLPSPSDKRWLTAGRRFGLRFLCTAAGPDSRRRSTGEAIRTVGWLWSIRLGCRWAVLSELTSVNRC